jgi:hypothetical protein
MQLYQTKIINLIITDETEELLNVFYNDYLLNKKEIFKFLTNHIDDEDSRKKLKQWVLDGYYTQTMYDNLTSYVGEVF